jgi:hypothetical protein
VAVAERLKALAVGELDIEHAAVGIDQRGGVKFTLVASE